MPDAATHDIGIVVIEDHDDLRELTVDLLASQGYWVRGFDSVEALSEACPPPVFEIALLDVGLPGESGLALAERLRAVQTDVGILMVTAHGQLDERIAGYDRGADLYLCKPVAPQELLAAVAALARRLHHPEPDETDLALDLDRLLLVGASVEISLSLAEGAALQAFAIAPRRSLETWQLLEQLGKPLDVHGKAQLEVLLSRLRKKLIAAGAPAPAIKAQRQCGYRLCRPLRLR
ncbi:response regulator transcription factor [uncultured Thiocystis sp.]|jgi:DNA-binding response OmpR family regulator|uniref:response regulator transcription factor n=1 Tax=uncultured Thiocystis sp. TaxID=1202134 RepID=UPI0025D4E5FC|nr:response regulator transcription factor [uncultured Thiocystis sp.]